MQWKAIETGLGKVRKISEKKGNHNQSITSQKPEEMKKVDCLRKKKKTTERGGRS